MPARVYKSSLTELLNRGKSLVENSEDSRFLNKVTLVNLILSGQSPADLSQYCGISRVTLSAWVTKVDEEGFDALREKTKSGRPSKLTEQQLKEIDLALQKPSTDQGFNVWDGPSLREFIKTKYNVEYSERQCQRLFHKLGYSLIRPQVFPCKDTDSKERTEFKKNDKSYERR